MAAPGWDRISGTAGARLSYEGDRTQDDAAATRDRAPPLPRVNQCASLPCFTSLAPCHVCWHRIHYYWGPELGLSECPPAAQRSCSKQAGSREGVRPRWQPRPTGWLWAWVRAPGGHWRLRKPIPQGGTFSGRCAPLLLYWGRSCGATPVALCRGGGHPEPPPRLASERPPAPFHPFIPARPAPTGVPLPALGAQELQAGGADQRAGAARQRQPALPPEPGGRHAPGCRPAHLQGPRGAGGARMRSQLLRPGGNLAPMPAGSPRVRACRHHHAQMVLMQHKQRHHLVRLGRAWECRPGGGGGGRTPTGQAR